MYLQVSKAILKATDAKLRTDNWQYILEVCDIVRADPEDNGNEAVDIIEERLKQNDANVILRTLSLTLSLAENCGSRIKQRIDSKSFTSVLNDIIENSSIHIMVKEKVANLINQLSNSFKDDSSLRYMKDLYKKIKHDRRYSHLLKSESSNNSTRKEVSYGNSITLPKSNEEEELETALKLSLTEFESSKQQTQQQQPVQQQIQEPSQQQQLPQSSVQNEQPVIIRKVRAMYNLSATEEGELSFRKGDVITVLEQVYRDWWKGILYGKIGIFPLNYVTPISDVSPKQAQIEKESEDLLLDQKTNIDQLHYTLKAAASDTSSRNDITQNPQVNELYGSVTPLRPQIAKMIGKYSQKKDDLNSIRQILANAETTYNQLLDRAANAYIPPTPSLNTTRPVQSYEQQPQQQHFQLPPQPKPQQLASYSQPCQAPQGYHPAYPVHSQNQASLQQSQVPVNHTQYAQLVNGQQAPMYAQVQIQPPVQQTQPVVPPNYAAPYPISNQPTGF